MGAGASASENGEPDVESKTARIVFTKEMDDAVANSSDTDAMKAAFDKMSEGLKVKREKVILELRSNFLSSTNRDTKATMSTLLQEFQYTVRALEASENVVEQWKQMVRAYEGRVTCGSSSVPMGDWFDLSQPMLVVTPLSHECRTAYFEAVASKKVVCYKGPPGTGKTEVLRENARLTGRDPVVIATRADDEPNTIINALEKADVGDSHCPVILDTFNRIREEDLQPTVKYLQEKGLFVALSIDTTIEGTEIKEGLFDQGWVEVDMAPPPLDLILEAMLACEGFTTCRELSESLARFVSAAGGKSQIRLGQMITVAARKIGRKNGFELDEKSILSWACLHTLWQGSTLEARERHKSFVKECFDIDVDMSEVWRDSLPYAEMPYQKERLAERKDLFKDCDDNGNYLCSLAEIHACLNERFIFDPHSEEEVSEAFKHAFEKARNYGGQQVGAKAHFVEHREFRVFLEMLVNNLDRTEKSDFGEVDDSWKPSDEQVTA